MSTQHTQATALEQASWLSKSTPLVERAAEIDQRMAARRKERTQLFGNGLAKADLAVRILGWLRDTRDRFESGRSMLGIEAVDRVVWALSQDPPATPRIENEKHLFQLMTWLLWPQLEASVPDAVKRLAYDEGAPLTVREQRVPEIDAELAELRAERIRIVDEVAQISRGTIKLDQPPDVTQERLRAKSQQDWEEAHARANGIDARALDARHAAERDNSIDTLSVV